MNAVLMKRLFRAISDGKPEELHKMAKVIVEDEFKKGHGELAKELSSLLKDKVSSSHNAVPLTEGKPSGLSVMPRSRRYELL